MDSITLEPIGKILSCYGQKLGIPRQPGLAPAARALIELDYHEFPHLKDSVRGLEGFTHIWIIFAFHKNYSKNPSGLVRPPRLGGDKKVGAFASRSPYRPNPLGLSVVRLLELRYFEKHIELLVQGGDFLDCTPVLDIKPYLPYSDRLDNANTAWVEAVEDQLMGVRFNESALNVIRSTAEDKTEMVCECIRETLSLDPRPAFAKLKDTNSQQNRKWASLIFGFDVTWTVLSNECLVTSVELKERGILEKLSSS